MFTDDLQDALFKLHQFKKEIKPGDEEAKAVIDTYIQGHLKVFVGEEEVELKFLGFELEEESTWSYLEGTFSKSSNKITLRNSLLYDFLPGQSNMVHCYLNDARKSQKLDNPKDLMVFRF